MTTTNDHGGCRPDRQWEIEPKVQGDDRPSIFHYAMSDRTTGQADFFRDIEAKFAEVYDKKFKGRYRVGGYFREFITSSKGSMCSWTHRQVAKRLRAETKAGDMIYVPAMEYLFVNVGDIRKAFRWSERSDVGIHINKFDIESPGQKADSILWTFKVLSDFRDSRREINKQGAAKLMLERGLLRYTEIPPFFKPVSLRRGGPERKVYCKIQWDTRILKALAAGLTMKAEGKTNTEIAEAFIASHRVKYMAKKWRAGVVAQMFEDYAEIKGRLEELKPFIFGEKTHALFNR